MSRSARLLAAHKAVTELLAGKDVRIRRVDENVVEFASSMPSNTVNVSCLTMDVVVSVTRADWARDEIKSVRYPVSHDHPDFTARLGEVLLPVVEEGLAQVGP